MHRRVYDLIRYNSIQECVPNEPLSGYGMGFQTSVLQSLTFLCIIPLLLQYELVDKSTNKSGLRSYIGFIENFREAAESEIRLQYLSAVLLTDII